MTKKELIEKYPKIFSAEIDERYPLRMFGIECGDGWIPLLNSLCSNLQWNTDQNNNGANNGRYPQVVARQVKEKFGRLCFYVKSANDIQYGAINFASELSTSICELCGKFHEDIKPSGKRWIVTLCSECKDKQENV